MKKLFLFITILCLFSGQPLFAKELPKGQHVQPNNMYPKVKIKTTIGDITFELDRNKAPLTVNNFLSYVLAQRYNGTIFHRLEQDFVLQGGGYNENFDDIKAFPPIFNESGNGMKNDMGTISMARMYNPHSATSQFFINLADNDSLNPGSRWGYAVFGTIVEGYDFLDKLKTIEIEYSEKLGWPSFPKTLIKINSIEILAESGQ
jgi:peptidyl-prolyl cis-trans isomerase A (cyclophilin A)